MCIDFHTHIFPQEIRHHREKFFKGEPAFELLYRHPKSRMVGASELVEELKRSGVDKAVVFGFPWESSSIAKMHNDYVWESAKMFPDHLIPFACAGLASESGVDEIGRCIDKGFRGVGELAFYVESNHEKQLRMIKRALALCRLNRCLLLVHANEPVGHVYPGKVNAGLNFYYKIASESVGVPLIFAHWGGGLFFFNILKKEAPDVLKDVYYDTAASPFLYKPDIYRIAVEIIGVEKILFGTDYPLLPAARYFGEMKKAGLSIEEQQKIKGENAKKLLAGFRLL